jgi:hypothetical protein
VISVAFLLVIAVSAGNSRSRMRRRCSAACICSLYFYSSPWMATGRWGRLLLSKQLAPVRLALGRVQQACDSNRLMKSARNRKTIQASTSVPA